MKIRYFSDIHLERDAALALPLWQPTPHENDDWTTLVLAGDIWNGVRPLSYAGQSWLAELSKRFRYVVMVLGNHDYWGHNLTRLAAKWRELIAAQGLSNVHLLSAEDGHTKVVLSGVAFVGGTLWTNMGKGDPLLVTEFDTAKGMAGRALWNDRNHIRVGETFSRFRATHWLATHRQSVRQLYRTLAETPEPTIFVSHHAPCLRSVEVRVHDNAWGLYGSDLSNLLLDHPKIQAAIHGHVHRAQNYAMGDVRVYCNPRGYAGAEVVDGYDDQAHFFVS